MELFGLDTTPSLKIGNKIQPLKFKHVLTQGALEKDLEDLIVAQPSLLNWSGIASFDSPDLLIIDRQPRTQTGKRADLFGVSVNGELVIIEIKRDAEDERGRREGMEFQAIRYAAASRKMTATAIIDMYANYLKNLAKNGMGEKTGYDAIYRGQAVARLCEHLADADEDLTEADLEGLLDPKEKQKIYLVAAGYEADVLSACAWLRAHEIDIACFQLRPYKVSDQYFLERQRLIPPPQLDDFLVEMRPNVDGSSLKQVGSIEKQKSDKPKLAKWEDDPDNPQALSSWKELLVEGTKRALQLGLALDMLPMAHSVNGDGATGFHNPALVSPTVHIETHGNSDTIMKRLSKMLRKVGKRNGFLQVVTQSGRTFDVPEDVDGES